MPELPEVETTARALRPYLENQELTAVSTSGKALRHPIPNLQPLIGHTVTNITRRAKYILVDISNGQTLILHLGMSGRILAKTPTETEAKHTHLSLTTAKGNVHLHDPRRFGLVLLHPTSRLAGHPLLSTLGPEPLDASFTPAHLKRALANRSIPIKVAIMNPAIVVGVGNIYASESLFLAGINPLTPANRLTAAQQNALVTAIRATLETALTRGGTTLRDYQQIDGTLGHFFNDLSVYGRTGQSCTVCGTPIQSATLGQRSTFWCPHCQQG